MPSVIVDKISNTFFCISVIHSQRIGLGILLPEGQWSSILASGILQIQSK